MLIKWLEVKWLVDNRNIELKHIEQSDYYKIYFNDGQNSLECMLAKNTLESTEFENDYKSNSNKITTFNTTIPADQYSKQMNAVTGNFTSQQTTTLDFKVENFQGENFTSKYLWGGELILDGNEVLGDYVSFSVIDIDNIFGYGNNVTLKTYVIKMFIKPNEKTNCKPYAAGQIPVGTYLRCSYTSIGSNDVTGYLNYDVNTKG